MLDAILEPLRVIPGPVFIGLYLAGMVGLPYVLGRRWAGVGLLTVGGLKTYLGLSHGKPITILVCLLLLTLVIHILADVDNKRSGGSCSGGGFFFFGGGGCGSSCGSSCGSTFPARTRSPARKPGSTT